VPNPQAAVIVLTDGERAELEGWARRRTSAAGLVLRSRIVLAAADGESNSDMAARMGISRSTVKRWRNRFVSFCAQRGPDYDLPSG
jgi:DNA-binding NarL/FixJ family response regulator